MTASVIAATLTTPDDITRPADSLVNTGASSGGGGGLIFRRSSFGPDSSTSKSLNSAVGAAPLTAVAKTGSGDDTVECLANKLTPNDARVMVDLLKLAVAGRVSAAAQSILSTSLAAIGRYTLLQEQTAIRIMCLWPVHFVTGANSDFRLMRLMDITLCYRSRLELCAYGCFDLLVRFVLV